MPRSGRSWRSYTWYGDVDGHPRQRRPHNCPIGYLPLFEDPMSPTTSELRQLAAEVSHHLGDGWQ
jgi:hypothetical protein